MNVHSKLLIVDDVFALIGSANLNRRSMVSDNEIDIGTDRPGVASGLRHKLFQVLLGDEAGTSVNLASNAVDWPSMYDIWKRCLDRNWELRHQKKPLVGQLFYLYDPSSSILPTLD